MAKYKQKSRTNQGTGLIISLISAAFKCNYMKELSPLAKAEMREIISPVP